MDVRGWYQDFVRRSIDLYRQSNAKTRAAPSPAKIPYHALIDSATRVVYAISPNPATITVLGEAVMDSQRVIDATSPNYQSHFPLLREKTLARWSWVPKGRVFTATRGDVLTPELTARTALASAKAVLLDRVIYELNKARLSVGTGLNFQETVYLTKKSEAAGFKACGYDEARIFEFPYVLQYADFAAIPFRDAANEILLRAKFDDQLLLRTEQLRLKYFRKIKEAPLSDIDAIRAEFQQDVHERARV